MDSKENLNREDKNINQTSEIPVPSTETEPTTPNTLDTQTNKKKKLKPVDIAIISVLSAILIIVAGSAIPAFIVSSTLEDDMEAQREEDEAARELESELLDAALEKELSDIKSGDTLACITEHEGELADQIETVCDVVSGAFDYIKSNNPNADIKFRYEKNGPAYKPDYLDMATIITPVHYSYNLALFDGDSNILKSYLTANGFSYVGLEPEIVEEIPYYIGVDLAYKNNQTGVICSITDYAMPYDLLCSHESWYIEKDSQVAKLHNGLAKALKNTSTLENADVPLNVISYSTLYVDIDKENFGIKNSQYAPYQTVTAGWSNGLNEFYRVNQEADWVFVGGGNGGALGCSEYNTDDAKKAFAGEQCYDEDNNYELSTVTYP